MSPFAGQEGDLKLTQSMAIVRHLARKFNLVGQTEAECARADMIVDQLGDYRWGHDNNMMIIKHLLCNM